MSPATRSRRRRGRSWLPGFLLMVLLLLAIVMAIVLVRIPAEAASIFGEPAAGLNTFDRLSLSIKLLSHQTSLMTPLDPAGMPVSFEIQSGETVPGIAARMAAAGLIPDAGSWTDYLVYSGLDTNLQAGTYRLSPALNPAGIAESMQDPRSHEINFAILPGWRLEEIAASLPTSGLAITPEEFLAITRSEGVSSLDGRLPADLSLLEGYLLPGEYPVIHGATLDELLPQLLEHFFEAVSGELNQAYVAQGLSLDQAVTLASLVEREVVLDEEMPLIASVFLNRLAIGMRMESDPTVQYALGFDALSDAWWKVPLSGSDLSIDSPFNTYIYAGLPPSPICNPSVQALQAVAYPEVTEYFFFRAACDGSGRHLFSITYEEHRNNACP
jgi:UPF0755 protein